VAEITQESYQAAVDWVLSFADYERLSRSAVVFDLVRMEALLDRLGDPHVAARSVHVAGTKGKGSTSAMIASVLAAAGYRTGLYTSPHLLTIRERIQFDGQPISEEDFTSVVRSIKPDVEALNQLGRYGELTTFEILTAMAFVYFRQNGADFQVMEVGLGGRLDATNVVEPEVCAITPISLDHTEVLGNTIAQIAGEKAGIVKPNTIVISAPQPPEAAAVIEEACRERGSRLITVGKDIAWYRGRFSDSEQSFRFKGVRSEYDLSIPLVGEHQIDNAAVAVGCLEVLAATRPDISRAIPEGLSQVCWPGRLQVLHRDPLFVVDGAHNAYSVRKLGEALKHYFRFEHLILLVGVSGDKNVAGIGAEASRIASRVIVTRSRHPRAADAHVLAAEFSKHGCVPEIAEDTPSAAALAFAGAKAPDLICATGSLFIVSEAMEYFSAQHADRSRPFSRSDQVGI